MAPSLPSAKELSKPEDLKGLLKEDRGDDCLSCRIVGTYRASAPVEVQVGFFLTSLVQTGGGAFLGLAAYSYLSGMYQLDKQKDLILKSKSRFGMRSRKFGIVGISMSLAYLGLWRLIQ
jgi:hypothetical protein